MSFFTKRYHPPGTAPGTLVKGVTTERGPLRISVFDYDSDHFAEHADVKAQECREYLDRATVTWIHVEGYAEPQLLRELGEMFDLHPLALEDVQNTGQRPKVERYEQQYFVIASLPVIGEISVEAEQISLFLGTNYVVSFHDGVGDPFEPVRKRLRNANTRFRTRGADYLLYALLDVVIDEGFPVLESFGEWVEDLEEALLESPGKDTLSEIHRIKRDLLLLRRMLWPQREVLNTLYRDEHMLISTETKLYLRDCYDHTVQVMDLLETYRDMASSMLDVYLSSASNRLNEVMRVLTVIATLFIPPSFIASVYGMNFDRSVSPWNMPELGWRYGYPLAWLLMIVMIVGMLIYFKRKRWF